MDLRDLGNLLLTPGTYFFSRTGFGVDIPQGKAQRIPGTNYKRHNYPAIDYAPMGEFIHKRENKIKSLGTGVVSFNGWIPGYGYVVMIQHYKNLHTFYAHLVASPFLRLGDKVPKGSFIGYTGATGGNYGNHLHFEIRLNTTTRSYVNITQPLVERIMSASSSDVSKEIVESLIKQRAVYNEAEDAEQIQQSTAKQTWGLDPEQLAKLTSEEQESALGGARDVHLYKQYLKDKYAQAVDAKRILEAYKSSSEAVATMTGTLGGEENQIRRAVLGQFLDSYRTGGMYQSFGSLKEVQRPGILHADIYRGIPVSDEKGYEVVGGFAYGRGMALVNNGEIRSMFKSETVQVEIEKTEGKEDPRIVYTDAMRKASEDSLKKGEQLIKLRESSLNYWLTDNSFIDSTKNSLPYDAVKSDHVSRYTGGSGNAFDFRSVGRYLSDFAHFEEGIPDQDDAMKMLQETEGVRQLIPPQQLPPKPQDNIIMPDNPVLEEAKGDQTPTDKITEDKRDVAEAVNNMMLEQRKNIERLGGVSPQNSFQINPKDQE